MPLKSDKNLIEILTNCAVACNHCATSCLNEKDVVELARCIRLDIDCSDICQLAASFLSRGSEHINNLLRVCIEICESCAEECDKHAHMEHCKKCAIACRECAEACSVGNVVLKAE